jgi:hypothetical protein
MRLAVLVILATVAAQAPAQMDVGWTTVAEVQSFLGDVFIPLGNIMTGPTLTTGDLVGGFPHFRGRLGVNGIDVRYFDPDDPDDETRLPLVSLLGELEVGLLPGWGSIGIGRTDAFVRLGLFPVEELDNPKYITYGLKASILKDALYHPAVSLTFGMGNLYPIEIMRSTYEVFKYDQRITFGRATVSYKMKVFTPYIGFGYDNTGVTATYDVDGPPIPPSTEPTPILDVYYENAATKYRYYGGVALGVKYFTLTAEFGYADDRIFGGLAVQSGF